MRRQSHARRGVTIPELLVVLGIILLLASLTIPAFIAMNKGRLVKDASRQLQAAIASSRDQASSRGIPIGIRLLAGDVDDPQTPEDETQLVSEIIFIRAEPGAYTGTCHLCRSDKTLGGADKDRPLMPRKLPADPEPNTQDDITFPVDLVVPGATGNGTVSDLTSLPTVGVIRFDDAGAKFGFTKLTIAGMPNNEYYLRLTGLTPILPVFAPPSLAGAPYYSAPAPHADPSSPTQFAENLNKLAGLPFKIEQQAVPLEGAEPIKLPQNIVIDLGNTLAGNAEDRLSQLMSSSGTPQGPYDILFSPSGQVMPPQVALPFMTLWVREKTSSTGLDSASRKCIKTSESVSSHSVVVIQSHSGFVTTTNPVLQALNNGVLPANDNDGLFDFEYYFSNVTKGLDSGF